MHKLFSHGRDSYFAIFVEKKKHRKFSGGPVGKNQKKHTFYKFVKFPKFPKFRQIFRNFGVFGAFTVTKHDIFRICEKVQKCPKMSENVRKCPKFGENAHFCQKCALFFLPHELFFDLFFSACTLQISPKKNL